MNNVILMRPEAHVVKVHWKFLKHVGTCRGIEIHIIATEKAKYPEYVVVMWEVYDGWYEMFRIAQASEKAWELISMLADKAHTAVMVCESTWVDRGLMKEEGSNPTLSA